MVKKLHIKHSQYPSTYAIVTLAVIITAILVLSVLLLWQKKVDSSNASNLDEEIKSLKNRITFMQDGKVTDSDALPPENNQSENFFSNRADISFTKCGHATIFMYEKWYTQFADKLKEKGFTPKGIPSACLSDKAEMLIFIAQEGKYCEGPKIYRYNIVKPLIESATVISKGVTCLGSVKEFGKREGNVIHIIAPGGDGTCKREEYYDYDFIKNTVTLIKSRSLCAGDSDWKWTEY